MKYAFHCNWNPIKAIHTSYCMSLWVCGEEASCYQAREGRGGTIGHCIFPALCHLPCSIDKTQCGRADGMQIRPASNSVNKWPSGLDVMHGTTHIKWHDWEWTHTIITQSHQIPLIGEQKTFLGGKGEGTLHNWYYLHVHTRKGKLVECLATVAAGIHGQTPSLLHIRQTSTAFIWDTEQK